MKAIQLEQFGIDHLKLVDIRTPHIGENEVLVKTSAVSLQYLDLIMVEGNVMPDLKFPHIPVSEGMGVVEQVGKNVTRWKKGDRVLIPFIPKWESGEITTYNNQERTGMQLSGTLAEFSVQPENTLVFAPKNLSDEESASLSVAGLTAWANLVTQANIKAGAPRLYKQMIKYQSRCSMGLYIYNNNNENFRVRPPKLIFIVTKFKLCQTQDSTNYAQPTE